MYNYTSVTIATHRSQLRILVHDTTLTHSSIADYVDALVCLILLVVSDARISVLEKSFSLHHGFSVVHVAYVFLF